VSGPETLNASTDGDWEALARNAAAGGDANEAPLIQRELLIFMLGDSPYAIPVERVREIVRQRAMTRMPRVPAEIRGVITLRGEVVQVVDLRMCLGLSTRDSGRRTRIIVLHGEDDRVTGIFVDGVREVVRVPEDDVRPATGGEGDSVAELFLSGEEFVSIVDLDRVLEFRGDD
jgi:purine-binding chemotaxis protein CheW